MQWRATASRENTGDEAVRGLVQAVANTLPTSVLKFQSKLKIGNKHIQRYLASSLFYYLFSHLHHGITYDWIHSLLPIRSSLLLWFPVNSLCVCVITLYYIVYFKHKESQWKWKFQNVYVHAAVSRFCVSADNQSSCVVECLLARCRCQFKVVPAHSDFRCPLSLLQPASLYITTNWRTFSSQAEMIHYLSTDQHRFLTNFLLRKNNVQLCLKPMHFD